MGIRRLVAVSLLLAGGCAELPVPAGPKGATIQFLRANPELCGHAGSPICEARVNHVEGKPVWSTSSFIEVEPGRRTLGVFCRINLSIMIGDSQSFQRELEATLAPGARYRVEAAMQPRPCTVSLIDESTGKSVGAAK